MRVHFIAIGGSAMHNLAIALHSKGFEVTGSDDEIFEPSKTRLAAKGLLPEKEGWNPDLIHAGLDAVILGMHARTDNPELLKAQRLGLKIYSYPEYIYEQSKDKIRVVIGGSHGKTSITAMVLHVLKHAGIDFDYMVGAQLNGFDTMVKLSHNAGIIVLEGDEYLSSPIDRRPKFHLYHANIALLSGIAWDHINVFPTFADYLKQFELFLDTIQNGGTLVYCVGDPELKKLVDNHPSENYTSIPYTAHPSLTRDGISCLINDGKEYPILIFGDHNLQNLNGAKQICGALGVEEQTFYEAIVSFKGAAKRLELVNKNEHVSVFKDFAHSPSKLKATTQAVKKQFPDRKLIACMELHTFSSLNQNFLNEYQGAMDEADIAIVYYNPHTIAHKKLAAIDPQQVINAFHRSDLKVFTDSEALKNYLLSLTRKQFNLLLMSSGNFDGMDFDDFANRVLDKSIILN